MVIAVDGKCFVTSNDIPVTNNRLTGKAFVCEGNDVVVNATSFCATLPHASQRDVLASDATPVLFY